MLTVAFVILGAAVLLGSVLAVLYLRTEGAVPAPWPLAALHGLVAVGGLFCLALALRGPLRGVSTVARASPASEIQKRGRTYNIDSKNRPFGFNS
jgi:hypothetical protein